MRPLEGVRVVSLEQYGAGPFATLHLADLGAQVIKVEDPHTGGDIGRHVPPYQMGTNSLFFETFNRNKQSMALDMGQESGRGVFLDLVACSDAVFSNLRGDVPEKLGIRFDDLCNVNPRIVCCSLSGFGMTGPRRQEPGYDYVVQALAGWMSVTGDPDGPPTKSGLSLVDFSGGLVAAGAILAGVLAARRDGRGMDCDLSLFDTAIGMLTYVATWQMTEAFEPVRTRNSAHPSIVPFQAFEASDGFIVIGCAKEKFFRRLCEALDLPHLSEDPRFGDFASRRDNAAELLTVLQDRIATKPVGEWVSIFAAAGVPYGPVQTVGQALADEQTAARGLVVATHSPDLGFVRSVASPMRVGAQSQDHRPAPRLGEDGAQLMAGLLGYDEAKIKALAAAGAFG